METGLTKNQIIEQLTKSPHGDLKQYVPVGRVAAKTEAEFLAHLIAWNQQHGQVRDSKVALPVVSLGEPSFDGELAENSLAHLAMLDPRNLVRALTFGAEAKTPQRGRALRRLVEQYLRTREASSGWWNATVVQHRASMKTLYARWHVKPSPMAERILFKQDYPAGSVFADIAGLKSMEAKDAAAAIMERRIPFLVAVGALGARAKETDLVLALIERMSPLEVVTNTKMLERLNVKAVPALRAAFEAKLQEAAKSKGATFKTTRAAEAMTDDSLKEKLRGVQEKQIKALGGVEGNWLVLGDKSGSMAQAIDVSKMVAGTLARAVKGWVLLCFFDSVPRFMDATGKSYDEICGETHRITASGGTSIGCGLQHLLDKGVEVDGIAIVSDGGEGQLPAFARVYPAYSKLIGKEPPVYFYRLRGDPDRLTMTMQAAGLDMQTFDLTGGVDYYSLPNIVATMSTRRYGLVDQIMETPLMTVAQALQRKAA